MSYLGGRRIYIDSDGYEHFDYELDYEPKPGTNADRIRSMTNMELAEFLYIKCCEGEAGYPQYDNILGWLNWLKQESKEQ